jgi:hypothetical protein
MTRLGYLFFGTIAAMVVTIGGCIVLLVLVSVIGSSSPELTQSELERHHECTRAERIRNPDITLRELNILCPPPR